MKQYTFRCKPELWEAASAKARQEGLSLSVIIRNGLADYLEAVS